MDLRHDVVFAFYIDVGGRFVEDVHRTVVQQRAGERQPLALTAGEVAPFFGHERVQPVFAAQEIG